MAQRIQRKFQRRSSQSQIAKKWKGKDWFDILSPPEFGGKVLYQTPSTDSGTLVGRNVNVPASEITGDRSKYFMWLKFKIVNVKGTSANTIPNGFQCMNEYLSRIIRKRKDKIEITHIVKTKDGWKVRLKPLIVTRKNVSSSIRTDMRRGINELLDQHTKTLSITDLTKDIINGSLQMKIKKSLSKTYPVRFAEIGRMKVLERGTISEALDTSLKGEAVENSAENQTSE